MKRRVWTLLACAVPFLVTALVAAQAQGVDAAFKRFWEARTPQDAARVVADIVASGVSFDEALKRFKAGRPYSANVPKGVVRASYDVNGVEYFYAVNVPASYDPARRQQVRIQLHGGVSREDNGPRGDGTIGALAGAEQIYIIPYAWRDAPWWGDEQIANLRTLLDKVKRTYNVDENRVARCRRLRRRNRRVLRRDARHDAVCELPVAQRVRHGAAVGRRRRSLPEQSSQQAILHRQRRPGSVISHADGRARTSSI